jgi:hypothetical protein
LNSWATFCCGRLYLTFTNGTAGSADYTTTSQTVTYLRVLLREL